MKLEYKPVCLYIYMDQFISNGDAEVEELRYLASTVWLSCGSIAEQGNILISSQMYVGTLGYS